ncbi:MAG: hypothetical protein RLZZ165_685 [Bacteroidota bacterium]
MCSCAVSLRVRGRAHKGIQGSFYGDSVVSDLRMKVPADTLPKRGTDRLKPLAGKRLPCCCHPNIVLPPRAMGHFSPRWRASCERIGGRGETAGCVHPHPMPWVHHPRQKKMPEPPGGDSRHQSTEKRAHPVGRLWIKKEICGGGAQCLPPAAEYSPQQGRDAGGSMLPDLPPCRIPFLKEHPPVGVFPGCWCQVRAWPDAGASAFAGIAVELSGAM